MRKPSILTRSRQKRITAADVGKYLKSLSTLHRDQVTGNPAMSDALQEIAGVLLEGKFRSASEVLRARMDQGNFKFEDDVDFSEISLSEVRVILKRADLTKSELTIIGTDRFGIAKSRLDRATRDEIIQTIESAAQHEESLAIISEEAQRHTRSS